MKLILHKNIKSVKKQIESLFEDSEVISAYQSYDFLKNLFSQLQYNPILKSVICHTKIRFAEVLDDDGKLILIMPLEIGKNSANPIETYDVYDVIAGKNDDKTVISAIQFLMKELNSDFKFVNVTDQTRLHKLLSNCKDSELLSEHGCGNIICDKGYDEYYHSLSKSSRQNLRTAYNRMEKDGLKYKMEYYFGKVSSRIRKQAKTAYLKRYYEKNPQKKHTLKGFLKKFYEPISTICANSKVGFHAFLKIDGKIAAVMSGFVNGDKICIPRLLFNSEFSKYSPGNILINETIKDIIVEKGFKNLDLGYGDENYKFVMGATPYVAYTYKLKRN